MKKKIVTILIWGILILVLTGCGTNTQENKESESYDKELVACIENELGGYILTENDELKDIPLSKVKVTNTWKIAYYKGSYASNHPDNRYVIYYPKDGVQETAESKDFVNYFVKNYSVYQMSNISSISIYTHSENNDVDLNAIAQKCIARNDKEAKSVSPEVVDKLNDTNKIIVKINSTKIGEITDKEKLSEILKAIKDSKQYGDAFLCDNYTFDFEMYDKNYLIDTVHVYNDGKRLMPKSLSGGCAYYTSDIDLRKIIEEETDYVFYSILNYSDNSNQEPQLIYQDNKYAYYLNGKEDEILIIFNINNQVMTLKYALENNYISAQKVTSEYPDILIKK